MSLTHSPSIVTNGLVMYYDMTNTGKSSIGAPTTNISTGTGIGTYLNTPSDVTSTLTQTGELYKGQPVYKQVLTPVTATGVSYLTNAGNPGIGVVTGGGGGASARFTGHSIFFKPAAGRSGLNASTPIYTHYSNIGGWQSTGNYDDMGDGWYRAHVIFYSAGGGSDGKYWAINPAGATLGVPITIYWAAPFKEDRNDSTHVSPYVNDTRSNTQSILDLMGNNTITANSLTYASNGAFSFNGSSNFMNCGNSATLSSIAGTTAVSVESWVNLTGYGSSSYGVITHKGYPWSFLMENPGNTMRIRFYLSNSGDVACPDSSIHALNTWYHFVGTYDGANMRFYRNGILTNTVAGSGTLGGGSANMVIGSYEGAYFSQGQIPIVKIYNRTLSNTEILQNFNATRGRYGI